MKKTVSILALLLLVGCESATKDTGHVSEDLDTEIDVDSSSWKTFEDEEIGIAFKYPGGKEAKLESELNGIDTGDKKEIATEDFTVTLTSEDYGMGISEGCCYYFPGKTVDLSQADESVKSVISKELGEVYNFERVSVDGKAAVHFLRVNSYIASSVVETLLIPYDHEIYSNIMISGSRSDFFESEEAIQEYIENFESNEVFEKFLASFEFLEIETTPEEASVKPVEVEYNNFTFSWPESWSVEEKMDENTYKFRVGSHTAYFSIVAKPDITYKETANLFLNSNHDLEITVEGANGVGFNQSSIIYAYGVWDEDLMYFVTISNPSASYSGSYNFKQSITKSEFESFLKTFEKI